MSLYTDLIDAGIECSSWQSDLYFPINPESSFILNAHHKEKLISSRFRSKIDGRAMYEVPFAFDPFWEA